MYMNTNNAQVEESMNSSRNVNVVVSWRKSGERFACRVAKELPLQMPPSETLLIYQTLSISSSSLCYQNIGSDVHSDDTRDANHRNLTHGD